MIQSMTVAELKSMMAGDHPPTLVDCREPGEWEQGHIPGATLIPLSELDQNIHTLEDKKSLPVILQCRSGKRSLKACQFLSKNGFENLYNLEGGILAWMEEGHDIQNSQ